MNYNGKNKDLVLIYVVCPKSRKDICELTIKSKGQWVKDPTTQKIFKLPVLAKSSRNLGRTSLEGDTPQGIYTLWGSMMDENPYYGEFPRIDLDAAMPPLNSHSYELNSYLLSEIVPPESLRDYWINEWPLAYKLGRVSLRIHANSVDPKDLGNFSSPKTGQVFRLTEGCLNAGGNMKLLLGKLIELGVFSQDLSEVKNPLGWKVSPSLGKTFVIVKDE